MCTMTTLCLYKTALFALVYASGACIIYKYVSVQLSNGN